MLAWALVLAWLPGASAFGSPGIARAATTAAPTLAGQWRGRLVVGEGRTAELIVDLARLAERWVGQFDLQDFGVEDYPVDVVLDGRQVRLHLSAAQIEVAGTLSARGDVLSGIASTRGERDSLVLKRTGEAQLSQEFLALERVADDPTRLESLSGDANLRQRFNDDRDHTRLVMLLSPS